MLGVEGGGVDVANQRLYAGRVMLGASCAGRAERDLQFRHGEDGGGDAPEAGPLRKPVRKTAKLGRNDPCHCGSGKKYKNCHMLQERQRAAVN